MNFYEKIYEEVSKIPKGKVATYGQIALRCQRPRAARIVGYALHINPRPGEIPCHRVVNRRGELAASFAFGGSEVQKQLLINEGIVFDKNSDMVNLEKYLWI